jgi:hypothetical protein
MIKKKRHGKKTRSRIRPLCHNIREGVNLTRRFYALLIQAEALLLAGKKRVDPLWAPLSVLALVLSGAITIYWYVHVPIPGMAIGLLGGAAVFMTVRGNVKHGLEKTGWIIIVIALLNVEWKAINLDRHQQEVAQQNARLANQSALDTTLRKMNDLAILSSENIKMVTGGDSFCYMSLLNPDATAAIPIFIHHGDYPLYNVKANIIDLVQLKARMAKYPTTFFPFANLVINVGDLTPHLAVPFNTPLAIGDSSKRDINVNFSAKNGVWSEEYRIRSTKNGLREAILVKMTVPPDKKNQKFTDKTVFTKIDKDFPQSVLGAEWK